MTDRPDPQTKPLQDGYRLNAFQIPVLRALGFSILAFYVLLYDLVVVRSFSLFGYLAFIALLAAYAAGSWFVLRTAYTKVRSVDLGVAFLIADLLIFLAVIYRTGADRSLLFFLP